MIEAPTTLAIRLFGRPRFSYGTAIENTLPAKTLSLFAYLLLHRAREIARDGLAFTLWPDVPEEDARASLRRALYILQRWLPDVNVEWFSANRRTVKWNTDAPYWLDVQEFESLSRDETCPAEAVELYAGDLLTDLEDEWLAPERDRLREIQLRLLGQLTSQLRKSGDVPRAIDCAQRALKIDPWHENFIRELMQLRAAGGDRSGALREYRTFEEALKREMNAAPERETSDLFERLRGEDQDEVLPPLSSRPFANNLPAELTSLVGRDQEVEALEASLARHRLLTITGAGGIGKTRLAIRLGTEVNERYRDGVWLVELAPVSAPEFVPSTVAAALNIHESQNKSPIQSLTAALKNRRALLIFDNCEQVVDAAAWLADELLRTCPNVQIVATARQPLNVEGEQLYRVAPLAFPMSSAGLSAQEAMKYSAIVLFVERAQLTHESFSLTDDNTAAVADICRRLDGIALAIELAAARVRVLSPSRLNEGLKERFRLLTGGSRTQLPRHQTLRALIDWSYGLLNEREKALLRRISVFAGRFSLEAAAATYGEHEIDELGVLDTLSSLVEKSLVVAETGDETERYSLLESTREYLRQKLDECAEQEAAQRAHASYYQFFAERTDREFHSTAPSVWFRTVAEEYENTRSALLWALANDTSIAARIAGSLRYFWYNCGRFQEGLYCIENALRAADQIDDPRTLGRLHLSRAVLLWGVNKLRAAEEASKLLEAANDTCSLGYALRQCALAQRQEHPEQAEEICRRAADLLRDCAEMGGCAMALNTLGNIMATRGQFDRAYAVESQALSVAVTHGCEYAVMHARMYLADLEFQRGNCDQAVVQAIEALTMAIATRMPRLVMNLRCNLAIYRISLGQYAEAATDVLEALAILPNVQDGYQTAIALQDVALIQAETGNASEAARLVGYVDAFFSANSIERELTEQLARDRLEKTLNEQLSDAARCALFQQGASITEQQAVKEAFDIRRVAA